MGRGTRLWWRGGLLALGLVAAGLAGATSAQAVKVDMGADAFGTTILEICCWDAADERNDITLQPFGSVPGKNANDPTFPNEPLGVVVTDTATPLGDVTGRCVKLSAHTARCIELNGIDTVEAWLNPGDGQGPGHSFTVDPGSDGAAAPMFYNVQTSEANDTVSIPVSRGLRIGTLGGNDTITVGDPTTVRGTIINAAAGNDHIRLTTADWGTVYCGDGMDNAEIIGAIERFSIRDCEKVTP